MSALSELTAVAAGLGLPVETGVFSGVAPDEYAVLTPLAEVFALHADDTPGLDVQEIRVSLFTRGNYTARARQLVRAAMAAGFTVIARRYVGHEDGGGFHHYCLDAKKAFNWEEV